MKRILFLSGVIIFLTTTGCVVSEGHYHGHGYHGRTRVIVPGPVIVAPTRVVVEPAPVVVEPAPVVVVPVVPVVRVRVN